MITFARKIIKMEFISKIIYYLLKLPHINKLRKYTSSVKLGDFCKITFYPNAKKIVLGKNLDIRNYCNILVGNNAELIVGDNFFMNNSCSINCLDKIEIGENTLFGENVKLYDHNHQYSSEKIEYKKFNTSPIKIGKNCWLGSNVVVLKGVNIGDNSIIGAGCIIHKDVPPCSVIMNKQELIVKSNK